MASFQNIKSVNIPAGENLGGAPLGTALAIDGTGSVVSTAAATDAIIGYLSESPDPTQDTTGTVVPVALVSGGGIGLAISDGTVVAGAAVSASAVAPGLVKTGAATTETSGGIALEAGAAQGDVIRVLYDSNTPVTA